MQGHIFSSPFGCLAFARRHAVDMGLEHPASVLTH